MDANSDNDVGFQVGRRHPSPSSSRESSPVAASLFTSPPHAFPITSCLPPFSQKRQRRSFTPISEDGDLVVPVAHNEDTETPTPESAPLIRQAVGFSSVSANVSTYQASVDPQPVVPYYLPGQAPLPPPKPKPKPIKPRAPRRKRDLQYSAHTSKFKITSPTSSPPASLTAPSPGNSADTISSRTTASHSMIPTTNYTFSYANGNATAGAMTSVASDAVALGAKRPRKSTKRNISALVDDSFSQSDTRPPDPISTSVVPPRFSNPNPGGPVQAPALQSVHSEPLRTGQSGTAGSANGSNRTTQNTPRPLRMVTLLIEDMRSGVSDHQLAEVKVPLRVTDDPEDGFWADAAEICNALQNGPSRIDGLAKVYTMRGRFRQFFMRIDQFDQHQVQSAHLCVSKERTLNVFVEAPVPQGQLPRPPVPPPETRSNYNASSEREPVASHADPSYRPTYSMVTREDQMERLSKSSYAARPPNRYSPIISDSGSYSRSHNTTSPGRYSQQDHRASPDHRLLTPPIPGRLADTEEERDEAIANYIRARIENHPGWMDYMQSKAKPQRVSEVLKQYTFVDDRVRELTGRKTPAHWDGAPGCYVEQRHILRVLNMDPQWGAECQEVLLLVRFYGENGSRYEDARIVDMIKDTSPPKGNAIERFLQFLRSVDEDFTRDTLGGRIAPMSTDD